MLRDVLCYVLCVANQAHTCTWGLCSVVLTLLLLSVNIGFMMLAFCGFFFPSQPYAEPEKYLDQNVLQDVVFCCFMFLFSSIIYYFTLQLGQRLPWYRFHQEGSKKEQGRYRQTRYPGLSKRMGTEQNKPLCSILLFLPKIFCSLPFPEKSTFSVKSIQETASPWTSLSDISLYLKFLAALRVIHVKAGCFSVTCSAISDKLLLFLL